MNSRTLKHEKADFIKVLKRIEPKERTREEMMKYFLTDKNIVNVEYITYIRWSLDKNAEYVAKGIGTTRQTINNLESGRYSSNVCITKVAVRNQLLKMIIECEDKDTQNICMALFEEMIGA